MSSGQQRITIRSEASSDLGQVRAITVAAFSASHFGHNGEAELIDRLRTSGSQFISLVAEIDGRLVGHVVLTPVSMGIHRGMGLGPVSVIPEFQRQGIGSTLIRAGLDQVQAEGCPFVVVLGEPEFYSRFGFLPAARFGITCEFSDVPADAFQIRWYRGTTQPGMIKYHPAFSEVVPTDQAR